MQRAPRKSGTNFEGTAAFSLSGKENVAPSTPPSRGGRLRQTNVGIAVHGLVDSNRRRCGRCRLSFVPRDQPCRYLLARAVATMEVDDCGSAKDQRYLPVGRQAVMPIPRLNGLRQHSAIFVSNRSIKARHCIPLRQPASRHSRRRIGPRADMTRSTLLRKTSCVTHGRRGW